MAVLQRFDATGTGQFGTIQTFVAPTTGDYVFKLAGASGSGGNIFNTPTLTPAGGKGATLNATFALTEGDILDIVVGQMGTTIQATARDGTSGGAGGGTFIFRRISAITDSRYQFTKSGQAFEVLFVAAGGGGSNDTSYQGNVAHGLDGDADTIRTPTTNYIAANTASGSPSTSSSKAQGMGIQQYITYDAAGGYYARNSGQSLGGFGGGGCNDDAICAGGGWHGVGAKAYSWAIIDTASGTTGSNVGHGWVEITPPHINPLIALIYDRTTADLAEARRLVSKILRYGLSSLTEDEHSAYFAGLRGRWDYITLNRIATAGRYVYSLLNTKGIYFDVVALRNDWTVTDTPRTSQLVAYLAVLIEIKTWFPRAAETIPTQFEYLKWQSLNEIERFLFDAGVLAEVFSMEAWISDETVSGGD